MTAQYESLHTLFAAKQSRFRKTLWALVLVFLCAAIAAGATLSQYHGRVRRAVVALSALNSPNEAETNADHQARIAENIRDIGAQLPARETVLVKGASVEVDNTWLHEALGEYEKTNQPAERRQALARITERLRALDERLEEMESGKSSVATDKDADKGRLAEILRRSEYNKTASEGSALERLWMRFIRWFFSLFPKSPPLQPGSSRFLSAIAQVVVVLVGLALIAFLIWKFAPRFLRGRRKKKQKREARIVLGERLEPDQSSADLLAQAESLARSGNLRAAIRKAYIAFLCELADRKVISIAQHKTNRDYLSSVRERPSLYASMRKLTNSFEVHWYGLIPAGENDWNEFRDGYLQALKIP